MYKITAYLKRGALLSLLSLAVVACSSEQILPDDEGTEDPTVANDPTRREVQLKFDNKLTVKTTEAATRAEEAIATEAENHITSLDIYVFGSDKEEGPYTFQERFAYREDGSAVPGATKISLKSDGETSAIATLRPKKGLFSKFYCVGNQIRLMKTDGTEYNAFDPLEQSSPGMGYNVVTKAGVPTEADFLRLTTPLIETDPAKADEPDNKLLTPLPMVGAYNPALDLREISMSSRTRINMTLSRIVARFDIVNDASKSHFTITHISMGKGRRGVTMFPVQPVSDADPDKTLITYPDCEFKGDNINIGTQTGAFYSYPSPIEDKGYLIIKGKYALNMTDTPKDVSYPVSFKQETEGTGGFIEVKHNHRYTVHITDADPFKLNVNITVSEWGDGEELPYGPENELKVDKTEAKGATVLNVADKKATLDLTETGDAGGFVVTASSNAEIQATVVYPGFSNCNWLKTEVAPVAPVTRGFSGQYTCKVTVAPDYVANATANYLFPRALVMISSKAGREEVQYEVTGVLAKPTATGANPSPDCNAYDDAGKALSLFTVGTGTSSIKLSATAKGGTKLADVPAWITVAAGTPTIAGNAATTEYTLTLDPSKPGFPSVLPAESAAIIKVKNLSDLTKEEAITVKVDRSGVSNFAAGAASDVVYTAGDNEAVVDINAASPSLVMNFKASSAPTATITYKDGGGHEWVEVSTPSVDGAAPAYTCTLSMKAGYTGALYPEATVKFTTTQGAEEKVITVKPKEFLAPTLAQNAATTAGNSYTDATHTVEIVVPADATESSVSLDITAKGGSKLTGLPEWLVANKTEDATSNAAVTYKLTLDKAKAPGTLPASGNFKVVNYSDGLKSQEITVNLTEAAVVP